MLIRWGPLFVMAAIVLTACAGETSARPALPRDAATPSEPRSTGREAPTDPAGERLEIRAGSVRLVATLRDTAAARDLRAQLPARVTMRDHGGVEKTGPLRSALTVTDEPDGADPDVGDLGYYAPGHDLVLYYGDQSYFDGIVILGRLEGDLVALADLEGDIDVQVGPLDHNDK
jgi:hypothetical protein